MNIYMIQIVFPYAAKDPEVQTPIYFDLKKAVQEARELQAQCDPEDEKVVVYELFPDVASGFFRTTRPIKF